MTIVHELDGATSDTNLLDVLWLARALDGEGGDERAVAAAMLQRWVMLGGSARMSLARLLQSYCQPINPIWTSEGAMCRPGGRYHGEPRCAPDVTERRERRREASWYDLREEARDAAVWALYTDEASDYLPGAVHFAQADLVRAKMNGPEARREGWEIVTSAPADGHLYVSTRSSRAGGSDMRVIPRDLGELEGIGELEHDEDVTELAPLAITGEVPSGGLCAEGWLMFGVLGLGAALALSGSGHVKGPRWTT